MLRVIRYWIVRRRFSRMTRSFDRRIAAARAAHRPVKHLLAAKQAYVHGALAGVLAR